MFHYYIVYKLVIIIYNFYAFILMIHWFLKKIYLKKFLAARHSLWDLSSLTRD